MCKSSDWQLLISARLRSFLFAAAFFGLAVTGCGGGNKPSVIHDMSVSTEVDFASSGGCGLVTCASVGANCGPIGDGCGGVLECGSCNEPETCGGGGMPSVCGIAASSCVPLTACPENINCGPYPDGCGGLIEGGCGTCTVPGEVCGGGGSGKCGPASNFDGDGGAPSCTPATICPANVKCGPWGDGCGGLIPGGCGSCSAPQTCGGGNPGSPGICGGFANCVVKTCADYAQGTCGQQSDGCGGLTANCGTCVSPDFCGGGGASKCGSGMNSSSGCTGLCQQQMQCPSGTTSISGTVYAPTDSTMGFGNPDPINRAVVYVPNGAAGAPYYGVQPFGANVSCDKCGAPLSGAPLVMAQTGIDGKFKLDNVPVMANLPLVIQVGRWRRMITIPSVTACQDNALTANQTRLPRSHSEAGTTVSGVPVLYSDIPRIGFVTGSADPMECVLRKIGIADSEFGDPVAPVGMGMNNGHRVDFYKDNGANYSDSTPSATSLYDNRSCSTIADCPNVAGQACVAGQCKLSALGLYDLVVFACVGSEQNKTAVQRQNVVDYTNAGGRVFNTHFSYVWLYGSPSNIDFTGTATWPSPANQTNPANDPLSVWLDTSFPKGMELAHWIQNTMPAPAPTTLSANLNTSSTNASVFSVANFPPIGILKIDNEQIEYRTTSTFPTRFRNLRRGFNGTIPASHNINATVSLITPFGQILVNDPRYNFTAVTGGTTSQQWAYRNSNSSADTPQASPYVPMHYTFNTPVGAASSEQCGRVVFSDFHVYTGGAGWGSCDNLPMNAQEKMLEYMLFDLTGCVTGDQCVKKTCGDYGYNCGQWSDGCGGVTPVCGSCTMSQTCGGAGTIGHCGGTQCVPKTCTDLGYSCGVWADGCGGVTANCGNCPSPTLCGGSGVTGQCGAGTCGKLTCQQQNIGCGLASDGCGDQIDCGSCPQGQTCGGGGTPSQCGAPGCMPHGCPQGANCGVVADGCGGTVNCGTCASPETCGGGGMANQCGSTVIM